MFPRSLIVLSSVLVCGVVLAQDPNYELSLTDAQGAPGDTVGVTCVLDNPLAPTNLAGWSIGICHDDALVDPVDAVSGATTLIVNGGSPPSFLQINVVSNGTEAPGFDPGVNQGVVISFVGANPLPPGSGYELLDITYSLIGSGGSATLQYCETTQGATGAVSVVLTPQGGGGSITPTTSTGTVEVMAGADPYVLDLTDASGPSGSEQQVSALLDVDSTAELVAGWSFGVCHDAALVDVVDAVAGPTTAALGGGAGPAFLQINVIPNGTEPAGSDPGVNMGAVISFTGSETISAGDDQNLLDITYSLDGASGVAQLDYCETTLGATDFVQVIISPQGGMSSVTPTQTGGTITIVTTAVTFVRGDCNADGAIDTSDAMGLAQYLFTGGATPTCFDACDTNDDGELDVSDPVYLLNALFIAGPALPAPTTCGDDPTADGLDCASFAACP